GDFDGLAALDIVREQRPALPFIFVSGVVGEEFAINALRHGATDYVMKRGLSRLPAAVQRAIAEARERMARMSAQHALRLSETSAQLAIEAAGLGRLEYDALNPKLTLDARCRTLLGVEPDTEVSHELLLSRCDTSHRNRVASALAGAMNPDGSGKVAEECRVIHGVDGA